MDIIQENNEDFVDDVDQTQPFELGKTKKKRKNRRGGKSKKVKELEKQAVGHANGDSIEPLALLEPRQLPKPPVSGHTPPARPLCQIRTVLTGQGVNSVHGLFATAAMEGGTRIICEPPLITLPAPGEQIIELMEAFYDLDRSDQAKIWSLNPADHTVSPLLNFLYEQLIGKLSALVKVSSVTSTSKMSENRSAEFARVDTASEIFRIAARWHTGRRSMIDLPENERDQIPLETPITGLFIDTARIRHSCMPNCHAQYDRTKNLMTVHTTQDIASDEELTLSALTSGYYQTAEERANELKYRFGITCDCGACDTTHLEFAKHEQARIRTYARGVQLKHFLTVIDVIDFRSVQTDLHLRNDGVPNPEEISFEDLSEAETTCLSLIQDLKNTGCSGPEVIRWYNALIDRICPRAADELEDIERLRAWRILLHHAVACEAVGLRCFGADSHEYELLVHKRVRTEKFIAHAEIHGKQVLQKKKVKKGAQKPKVGEEWEIVGGMKQKPKEQKDIKDNHGNVVATLAV
ncbi:hypothetical protein GQ44DRAFT_215260 [Phaeosphaeriaceae sp. PMI808]|nr:hypothetical protein GQ44DRAFT_215260 [Phaeosphaeriaceae sp. PMI808]